MALFIWKNEYSVGINEIDQQHQSLFALGNQLHEARLQGKGREVLIEVLQRLFTYTQSHFAHEEQLMRLSNYPDLLTHKEIHDQFAREVHACLESVKQNGAFNSMEVMQMIKDWLISHIQSMDQEYAPCLIAHGVK